MRTSHRGMATAVILAVVLSTAASSGWARNVANAGDVCRDAAAGKLATSLDQKKTTSGVAVTEYRPRGTYRVVSCNHAGQLIKAVTAEPHRLPDGSVKWLPHQVERMTTGGTTTTIADFGDFRLYAGDWRAAVRSLRRLVPAPADSSRLSAPSVPPLSDDPGVLRQVRKLRQAGAAKAAKVRFRRGTTRPTARAAADWRCSNGDYVYSYIYKNSAAHYINLAPISVQFHPDFIQNINEGFNAWQYTYNICGFPAVNGVTAATVGYTQTAAATPDGSAGNNDGIEVVDAGRLTAGACNAALACTYRYSNLKHDVRMNQAYPWCNGWCPGYYDIRSVMAHEAGHVYGFNHAATNSMVMGPTIAAGDAGKRYLWSGDYRGLLDVY